MFDWAKNITLGGEIAFAEREVEASTDHTVDLTRLQLMAKYKF